MDNSGCIGGSLELLSLNLGVTFLDLYFGLEKASLRSCKRGV